MFCSAVQMENIVRQKFIILNCEKAALCAYLHSTTSDQLFNIFVLHSQTNQLIVTLAVFITCYALLLLTYV